MGNYCVYAHTFPNGKIYVGITKQKPNRRWRKGKSYIQNPRLFRAFEKYGWENVKHEILLDGLTIEEAEEAERFLIKCLDLQNPDKGYNIAAGGLASNHSEETKKKIGEKSKGRHHTDEYKRWISEKNSGSGNFMYGKHHTEETRRKISQTKKGHSAKVNLGKFGSEHPAHKRIAGIDKDGKAVFVFGSIVEAAEKMNRSKSCFQAALHGKQKTCAGLKWVYYG